MPSTSLPPRLSDILADLTKNQVVASYLEQHPGFDQHGPVPSHEALQAAMQSLVDAAHLAANLKAWDKLTHLDDIESAIGWLSASNPAQFKGESAKLFNDAFIKNPETRALAQELDFALAVVEKQSPETWAHIQNHTALTMLYFERQCAAEDNIRGCEPGTAFKERQEEALLLLLGAVGHDIGKAAIAPQLLHKSTRIDADRMESAIAQFETHVPVYPEKAHDIAFLRSANEGKIIFAGEQDKGHCPEATMIIDVGAGYSRGEMALTDETARQNHSAIWQRISDKAEAASLAHWLTPQEQQTLTMPKRGTVTDHEMAVIETHDEMSEAFFKAASVPPRFKAVPHIVSMERFRQGKGEAPTLSGEELRLTQIIHATDMLEALLAPRSYRDEAMPVAQAIQVMREDSKGTLSKDIIDHMVRNGTVEIYQPRQAPLPKAVEALTHPVDNFSPAVLAASYHAARALI